MHIDAQTQSAPVVQHDASSNTFAQAEQRHTGVQVSDRIGVRTSTVSMLFIVIFFLLLDCARTTCSQTQYNIN